MDEKTHKEVMELAAKYIHSIQTPLTSIQLLSKLLGEHLPPFIAYYHQQQALTGDGKSGSKDAAVQPVTPEQLAKIDCSPEKIHKLAKEVKRASEAFWIALEELDDKVGENLSLNSQVTRLNFDKPLKILVAEDDAIQQKIIRKVLSELHQVELVDNGLNAVELAHKGFFDLILMDFNMPKLNGPKAVEQITESISYSPVVIGLTNEPLKRQDKEELLSKGFHGFTRKPLNLSELKSLIG